jgi:acyl-CoA dehydrogenase
MYSPYFHEHELFIDSTRRFMAEELEPHIDQWERDGNFPDSVFRKLGEHGFLGLLVSEEFGGTNSDYHLAGAWCETFGELRAHGLCVGVNMHSVVVAHALDRLGTPEARRRWLPGAVTGEAIGAYAFTEPGVGSDLANMRTRADFNGKNWVINGTKTFITNGARANFLLVMARSDLNAGYGGFTTFVVDTKSPGFKVNKKLDKLGWRSSDTAELFFDAVEVGPECVLGKVGEGWIQGANNLNWERMMLTLTTLGGARSAYRDAVRYSTERGAFGRKIGEFEYWQGVLAQMYQKVVLGEAISHAALDLVRNHDPKAKALVSMAKRQVCADALWIADQAIQIHGGYGYTTEFSAERWWRDLRLMPIGGGTSEIMANVVRKELGF